VRDYDALLLRREFEEEGIFGSTQAGLFGVKDIDSRLTSL
jgi:hypothetical protein